MQPISPSIDIIGRIYGPTGQTPIKVPIAQCCFIVTRVTKAKAYARKLAVTETLKPTGNGFFEENNLGVMRIDDNLVMIGGEIPFLAYKSQINGIVTEYIRNKNMVLFHIDKDVVLRTLSSESSVFHKTPWT
jgi:hypothetical protein